MNQESAFRYQYEIDPQSDSTAARILKLVGQNKKVLELGCAAGSMTRALTNLNHCVVTGIEIDAESAEQARPFCQHLIIANLESLDWEKTFETEKYDVIIAADVLEHLMHPEACLAKLQKLLMPEGYFVLSLPNVGHNGVIAALLNQTFPYKKTGILDETHLRFFSKQDIESLLSQAGFLIETCEAVKARTEGSEFVRYWLNLPEKQRQLIDLHYEGDVYQYVIRAYPATQFGENCVLKQNLATLESQNIESIQQKDFQNKRNQELLEILRLYQDYVSQLELRITSVEANSIHIGRFKQSILGRILLFFWRKIRAFRQQNNKIQILDAYNIWFFQHYLFSPEEMHRLRKANFFLPDLPKISLLYLIDNIIPISQLNKSLNSIITQTYLHFDCRCAVATQIEPTQRDAYQAILERYFHMDHRFHGLAFDPSIYKEINVNTLLELAQGEWILLVKAGDCLNPDALYWYAREVATVPQTRLVYCDEDIIQENGLYTTPQFKPDWNFEYLLSKNYVQNGVLYQREALIKHFKKFDLQLKQAYEYDMLLQFAQHFGKYNKEKLRHIPRILYHASQSKQALDEEMHVLKKYLPQLQAESVVLDTNQIRQIHYVLPSDFPLVSLIIPTRNGLNIIRQCLDSVLKKTTYPCYEILIVDNGSDDPEILAYFEELVRTVSCIRVIRDDQPFNYAALNNHAVREAKGEFVLLLNNDTEVITPEWIERLLAHAIRPQIGAVGARLWYGDKHLQHGGVILIYGVAAHAHLRAEENDRGYMDRAICTQEFSAVTAACLLVRKSLYEKVGGLDETLKVGFNDVDFCLKLYHAGYINVWTPYAELYHHESATRGYDVSPEKLKRAEAERQIIRERFGFFLDHDPYYNPNLIFDKEDFSLAETPRLSKLP